MQNYNFYRIHVFIFVLEIKIRILSIFLLAKDSKKLIMRKVLHIYFNCIICFVALFLHCSVELFTFNEWIFAKHLSPLNTCEPMQSELTKLLRFTNPFKKHRLHHHNRIIDYIHMRTFQNPIYTRSCTHFSRSYIQLASGLFYRF